MRDRKFAVRFTSEDVKLTNLLIEDSRPKRGYLMSDQDNNDNEDNNNEENNNEDNRQHRKFAVRFTSEDVKFTNLLIEDTRPKRGYLLFGVFSWIKHNMVFELIF